MKKKKTLNKENKTLRFGFLMEETPQNPALHRGLTCLLKGFLVFCATFGTVAGVLDAFGHTYNEPLVFVVLLLLCFALAGLHYNRLVFNLFYPVIFFGFAGAIIQNRTLANSGFQAFLSVMYEKYSEHFELSVTRELIEMNTNRYLTITVTAIFVGFVIALLVNIAISTYMSAFWTIMLTAPILQVAIYINLYPNPVYFVPLIFSYIAVGVLGSFKHHNLPYNKKERETYKIIDKKNSRYHIYRTNGKALCQTTMLFAVVSLFFLVTFYPIAQDSISSNNVVNSVKNKTDEYVKRFVRSGLFGFFDRYQSTGGLSEGRLGGVSSVRPDYQTDLTVTFAPYSYDTIYLRSFIGQNYQTNSWSKMENDTLLMDSYSDETLAEDYVNYVSQLEVNRLREYKENNGEYALEGKMDIVNIDANPNYLYTPYYPVNDSTKNFQIKNQILTGDSPTGQRRTYTYYPAVTQINSLLYPSEDSYASSLALTSDELSFLTAYTEYCNTYYTYVPEHLKNPIQDVIDEIGYGTSMEDKISRVQNYFLTEYTYNTSPGTTPYNADFITFFLTDQKQGYCAHFASASTMILRYMGIPARYVEGYVIPLAGISDEYIRAQDMEYSEYLSGNSPIGETGVVEVDVTDANAHAWVEVYSEGFGWVPVEVTPPSDDEEGNSDFLSLFASLFSVTPSGGGQTQESIIPDEAPTQLENIFASTNLLAVPMFVLLVCLLLFQPLLLLIRFIFRFIKKQVAFKNGDYDLVAAYYYHKLFFYLLKKRFIPSPPDSRQRLSYRQKLSYMKTFAPQMLIPYLDNLSDTIDSTHYVNLFEKALYAKDNITKEEILTFIRLTKEYTKAKAK